MNHPQSTRAEMPADRAMYARISWRLMPLLLAAYVVAFLDRINVGYAQLQMKQTLAFSDAVYGLGAGIFFIGYLLFEVPSNLVLEKIGARKTLLRIMVCWGVVAMAMMFVQTPTQFYVLRFLLGAFEAGFTPGVLLYLTYWYPSARRGRMIAVFLIGAIVASTIAGPLSGAIMKFLDGHNGWHGWQWLFLVQGAPAPLLGIAAWFWLKDKPEVANWLSDEEKARLRQQLAGDQHSGSQAAHRSLGDMLRDPKVWVLSLVYVLIVAGTYAISFWTPTLIRSWGVTDMLSIGLYAAVPQLFAVVGVVLMGRSSDRCGERRWHFAAAALMAVAGLGITTVTQGHFAGSLAGLCLGVVGIASIPPIFFALTSEYLSKATVAAGIAMVSSIGNLGGAISPPVISAINAATGSNVHSMYFVMGLYLLASLIVLAAVRKRASPSLQAQAA
ncbi:MFS transporter [Ramlibacter solisilvae]|uniref:Major facilitator transporter n=1 Tax=Ramlibacter tataouinensis TaxID=94132 RepID=A0A127JW50_9BURK|nr:MFS transporter [Ramlibacter tataouinensis]AMO24109.1 major facilitator transporter [Ramlibacter tataouinensis]